MFRALTSRQLDPLLKERTGLDEEDRRQRLGVAAVLPFRVNDHVINELIDWDRVPDDPIFQLTFPQPGMLAAPDLARMTGLIGDAAPEQQLREAANEIRSRLNPHPANQTDLNEPVFQGRRLRGLQHKYRETVLLFPRQGQTCHAYCTYCFRWPQFVGEPDLRIATDDMDSVVAYLRAHPEVSNVLITGGDPLVMSAEVLRRHLEPLLRIPSIEAIRIGTKALAYWPQRFSGDPDADDLLRLFEQVTAAGRHLAVMAHFSHPRELAPRVTRQAISRILGTGAVIRCQAPVIRGVNDDAAVWAELWRETTRLGMIPYYLFIERDTGPQHYFGVPLARAYEIYRDAFAQVPGLARTARGPVASASPGKICIDGIVELAGERVFALRYLQARDPALVGRPFFAQFDADALWVADLKPAFGAVELAPA